METKMLFWGWGRKHVERKVSDTQTVVLNYRYFSVMFLFTAAFGYKFLLATLTDHGWATAQLSRSDADLMLNGQPLQPTLWARFSLLAGIIVVALVILVSSLLHK